MKPAKNTALSALLAALAVTVMYVGSLLGKIDIATAVAASVCVMISLGEAGYLQALSVYGITAVLSFIIVPSKTAPMLFAVLFGLYPVIKMFAESRMGKGKAYTVKYIYLNVMLAALVIITFAMFAKLPGWIVIVIFAVSNLLLPLYDRALDGIFGAYYAVIRRNRR